MSVKNRTMTANDIIRLLRKRHKRDIFISECGVGNPYNYNAGRIDFWAIKRDWANSCMWGYEIKVNRSDFLNDKKWMKYLSICNEFYFVCPQKLIDPMEAPENAGLLWVSTTGTRVYTKKKAPYREINPPLDLFKHIILSRACFEGGECRQYNYKKNYWKDWLQHKKIEGEFGALVSKKIQQRIKEEIDVVRKENTKLQKEAKSLKVLKNIAGSMNIDLLNWFPENTVKRAIENAGGKGKLLMEAKALGRNIERLVKSLEAVK